MMRRVWCELTPTHYNRLRNQRWKYEAMAERDTIDLNKWWPPHPTARLAEGLSLRREDMYDERVKLPEGTDSKPTGC